MAYSNSSDFSASISMPQDSDFVTSINMSQGSEEAIEMYCETCHSNGKDESAIAFCVNCVEYFCKGCLWFHTRFLPDHKHLENSDMPQDVCLEKCSVHTDQIIKFYCDTCDKFACKDCKKNNHETCRKVSHVPQLVKGIENGQELKEIEQKLEQVGNKLRDIDKAVDDNTQTIERNKDDATFAIESQADNVVKMIDKNKDKLKVKVGKMKQSDSTKLKNISLNYKKLKSYVETMKHQIKNQKDTAQRCKLFMTLKRAKKDIRDLDRKLSDLNKENVVLEYEFEPGTKLKTLAENEADFGKIVTGGKGQKTKVTFVQDINVKAENEQLDCAIWSMCLFPENFLIACDGRNCSIKSIDLRTSKMKSVLPMSNPICVSRMSYNKLVVSCISVSELSLISVSMSGILHLLDQKIKTEMPCWDAVCKNDQIIVALFQVKSPSAGKIQILNTNGVVLNSFQTNFMSKSFRISKIALSSDQTSLFMIDLMKDIVIQMTVDGEVKALYENEYCRQLNGLVASQSGSVFVCDSGSYQIHNLSADCSNSEVLLDQSHGLWRPISIAYSDKEGQFYVGQAHQNCIKVYKH